MRGPADGRAPHTDPDQLVRSAHVADAALSRMGGILRQLAAAATAVLPHSGAQPGHPGVRAAAATAPRTRSLIAALRHGRDVLDGVRGTLPDAAPRDDTEPGVSR